jgi:hypothetical protein
MTLALAVGLRVGPDVEALVLTFCGARSVAALAGCCTEALATCWTTRDSWIWRFTASLFAFVRLEEAFDLLTLQEEARQERRAYAEWLQFNDGYGPLDRNDSYGPDSD